MTWSFQCPIVTPEPVRLELSHGRYLDVKKELNTEEYRQMITEQFKETRAGDDGTLALALNKLGMNRVLAYVVGWSFVDQQGKPLPFSQGALNSFDFGTWQEILAAVDEHHARSEAEMEARKNGQGDASNAPPTSRSLSGVTGTLTGSAH